MPSKSTISAQLLFLVGANQNVTAMTVVAQNGPTTGSNQHVNCSSTTAPIRPLATKVPKTASGKLRNCLVCEAIFLCRTITDEPHRMVAWTLKRTQPWRCAVAASMRRRVEGNVLKVHLWGGIGFWGRLENGVPFCLGFHMYSFWRRQFCHSVQEGKASTPSLLPYTVKQSQVAS